MLSDKEPTMGGNENFQKSTYRPPSFAAASPERQAKWDALEEACRCYLAWIDIYGNDWCGPEGGRDGWLYRIQHCSADLGLAADV